ncbi:hypothetical protein Glove_368g26 [Diversispora epigaea]|uniref:Protein kinase domain-containing protein n=1 Tax=Diversispora epigaea TaxID=1348612 RepID=A0A397HAR0_9GLOM|nr:hypothetical protein Glove_368g26 [Diversispora epigaea]
MSMFEPDDYRTCHNCDEVAIIDIRKLCEQCYTSGNKKIDNFITDTQLSGLILFLKEYKIIKPKSQPYPYLVWVSFNNFSDIKYIAEGGFSKIFKATWNLNGQKRDIVLKVLNYSKNADTKFLNELKLIYQLKSKFVIKCYGATKDPKTKNYAFILDYAPSGDLNHFLHGNFKKVTWKKKINLFRDIIIGIKLLHDKKIIHCDLHSGNILIITNDDVFEAVISDLEFSQQITSNSENSKKSQIYGVIPCVAPELFKGEPYSYASDIYSLGMIMWQLTSGHRPFHDRQYGPKLILDILDGKRPESTEDTPECWENLMKKCWHPNPSQRPTIDEICQLFLDFKYYCDHSKDDIKKHYSNKYWLEFKKAEKARLEMIKSKKPFVDNPGYKHPGSRYFSRLLDLESISTITSSSDQNSELELSDQPSIDNFDIMNNNSDIENSVFEENEENEENLIFTFFYLLLFHILLHKLN